MFCSSCGHPLARGERFCSACGAPAKAPRKSRRADTLGGWPLVFVISLVAGAIALALTGIGGMTASAFLRGTLEPALGALAMDIVFWMCAYSLAVALACAVAAVLTVRRSAFALLAIQLMGIALVIAAIVLLALLNLSLMAQGANVIGRSVLSVAGGIAALILTTLFFCKSKHMRSFMGSNDFLRRALFRIGAK